MSSGEINLPQPTRKWRVGRTAVKVSTPGTFLLCDAGDIGEHFQDPPDVASLPTSDTPECPTPSQRTSSPELPDKSALVLHDELNLVSSNRPSSSTLSQKLSNLSHLSPAYLCS